MVKHEAAVSSVLFEVGTRPLSAVILPSPAEKIAPSFLPLFATARKIRGWLLYPAAGRLE